MIDSHVHLDDARYYGIVDEIVNGFEETGVEFVINNSCDFKSMTDGKDLAEKWDKVYFTVGLHPAEAESYNNVYEQTMTNLSCHDKCVAVGEIGLDYHFQPVDKKLQKDVFAAQLELTDKLKLPVTLHIRDAYKDAEDILNAKKQYLNNGVLWHCYSGSAEFARQRAAKGEYFAFGGAVTFRNADKEKVISALPKESILTETDGPYMSPEPFRGKINKPEYVRYVLQKIADVWGENFASAEHIITKNSLRLFGKIPFAAVENE